MFKYYFYFLVYYFKIQYQLLVKVNGLYLYDKFALLAHHKVRQSYDGRPYYYHTKDVANTVLQFSILEGEELEMAYAGALFHDLIEDCHMYTYNDIVKIWGKAIANVVYACTELRGHNREERHGPEFVKTLQESKIGLYVKLCDIVSNMRNAKETGHSMYKAYKKEYPTTRLNYYRVDFHEIFSYIETELL
jgi:(p)ppGpp synthase/HD superfamily hydrolase